VSVRAKVIEIVVLIALAIVAQVIVGTLGQVTVVAGNTLNTLSGPTSTAYTNFTLAGQSVTTVLNFMSIIFLIAAVVILLSLFGLDKIFQIGKGGRE